MATAYLIEHPPRIRQFRERGTTPSGVIVVHTAESTPDWVGPDTGAEAVAAFIADRTTYGSYHDICDSDSIVPLVPYHLQAYGDGTGSNPHAYHVSAATEAAKWPQATLAWREATVRNMARAAARYARWLHAEHGVTVPARRVTRAESDQRVPGFIAHGDRDPGRRSDPGSTFPWDLFLTTYAAELGGTLLEDDMAAEDVWSYKLGVIGEDAEIPAALMTRQTHKRAGDAREAARTCLASIGEIAKVLGNTTLPDAEKADLVDRIAKRTAAEVERLDAEAVADRLEITPKES